MIAINPAATLDDNPDKVEIHITPVVGDDIITSNAGCWGFEELESKPFSGKLGEVPGSETADAMRGAFGASPFVDFAALAKKTLRSR